VLSSRRTMSISRNLEPNPPEDAPVGFETFGLDQELDTSACVVRYSYSLSFPNAVWHQRHCHSDLTRLRHPTFALVLSTQEVDLIHRSLFS
jgi:hypothetical protein